ncbi:hypothetical protein EAJ09_13515, partial [Bacteroides stercoris]
HKISELVLCKDRIFTNITPQVFTLTRFFFLFFKNQSVVWFYIFFLIYLHQRFSSVPFNLREANSLNQFVSMKYAIS